ncbi:hypothetical protein, partial [Propionivibrio sp.]|uniref:hypothetical protein n=1 Tax=Propionivibrio sp. TaxID=2212460 RepID=UPI003BF28367
LFWLADTPPASKSLYERFLDVALLVVGLLAVLVVLGLLQNRKLEAQVTSQKAETLKFSGILADCMNGLAVYDRSSNTAHFCAKVISVSLAP